MKKYIVGDKVELLPGHDFEDSLVGKALHHHQVMAGTPGFVVCTRQARPEYLVKFKDVTKPRACEESWLKGASI